MSKQGYFFVNGLRMYYEIHGEGQPLVLMHGVFSGIGTSFGKLLPGTSHVTVVDHADWLVLVPMIDAFLDAPVK
jgi:hypothetical protein